MRIEWKLDGPKSLVKRADHRNCCGKKEACGTGETKEELKGNTDDSEDLHAKEVEDLHNK